MPQITVVKARRAHIPEVVEIWKDFMNFHSDIDPIFTRSPRGHLKFKDLISKTFGSSKQQLFVALDGKTVIGYTLVFVVKYPPVLAEKRYGVIMDAYVDPRFRRSGAGRMLFNTARDWFADRGIKRIELIIVAKNKLADAFWHKMGFEVYIKRMSLTI